MPSKTWPTEREIIQCRRCPRLRSYCAKIAKEKRRAYRDQEYWGKPVPAFGDPQARIHVVGLAPGAHGANRTGRIFTGDRSGDWLFRALYRAGLANQAQATDRADGLILTGARVTCVVKCAPPGNKPAPNEIQNCTRAFLRRELSSYPQVCVFVALGRLAWDTLLRELDPTSQRTPFQHGASHRLPDQRWVIASFHPSQQNTFTGKLTESMFDSIFTQAVHRCQIATADDQTNRESAFDRL
ncbi:MAG: uracil-DNA glycosylase [Oligoflexia bacterium]|jgi:uracil-DNA glycosylase family 4